MIADKNFEAYQMPTTRIIEVITSGTPLLIDEDLNLDVYIDKRFFVSNSKGVEGWLEKLKDFNFRKQINEEQKAKLKKWSDVDWKKILQ